MWFAIVLSRYGSWKEQALALQDKNCFSRRFYSLLTHKLTFVSFKLSSWCLLAALIAPSIWAWRPALLSTVTASWFSKVTIRRMILWWRTGKDEQQKKRRRRLRTWSGQLCGMEMFVFDCARSVRLIECGRRKTLTARGRERSQICRGSSGLWTASCAHCRTHLGSP